MSNRIQSLAFVILGVPVLAFGLAAVTANADTIYVCWDGSGDYVTIQEGIDAAVDGDEVVICDGTYTGEGNKNLDFGGRAITVRSENGPEHCVIDCQNDGRAFYFHSGETAASVVDGFTITNGGPGGAVFCSGSGPTFTSCTFLNNQSGGEGGGIACWDNARPVISGCVFDDNTARFGGGLACYWGAFATVVNCVFSGNTVTNEGGAIYCDGEGGAVISDSSIVGNECGTIGGGLYVGNCRVTLTRCVVSGNTALQNGGGLVARQGSTVRMTHCIIRDNVAATGYGGGIHYRASTAPLIENCLITGNFAGLDGGGIRTRVGIALMANCTVVGNEAVNRGGGVSTIANTSNESTFGNCVFWDNAAPLGPQLAIGGGGTQTLTVSFSDVAGGQEDVYVEGGSTLDWGSGNIDADPLFVDPDNHDYHLAGGSPCIDAGCNGSVPADIADLDGDGDMDEFTPFDLDGEVRFFDDPNSPDTGYGCPPVVDMGPYEFGDTGPQPCPGDLDCDRVVGQSDLGILLSAWQSTSKGDLDCNGETNQADLGILLTHWGEGCP